MLESKFHVSNSTNKNMAIESSLFWLIQIWCKCAWFTHFDFTPQPSRAALSSCSHWLKNQFGPVNWVTSLISSKMLPSDLIQLDNPLQIKFCVFYQLCHKKIKKLLNIIKVCPNSIPDWTFQTVCCTQYKTLQEQLGTLMCYWVSPYQ